jgi:2-polyprenyl-3-methyl-5-hydroxy-6-metoxy-1,4-benzoquinol methylase
MQKDRLEDFDKFADDYKKILDDSLKLGGEKGDYFTQYKSNYIARYLGSNFSGKILDYGCGIGLLSEVLLKQFPQAAIDGYDVSVASIERVPKFLKEQGKFTSDTSFLSPDYDVIVIANVLHHIEPADRKAVIARLQKLIKNNGKIIIFEHNPFNPLTRKVVRESPLDTGVVLLPFPETLSYLKNAGFKKLQLNYIVFFPKFFSGLRSLEPFLSWLPLGAQYTAIGHVTHDA